MSRTGTTSITSRLLVALLDAARQPPEDLLAQHGLKPGPLRVLDPAADLTLVTWQR